MDGILEIITGGRRVGGGGGSKALEIQEGVGIRQKQLWGPLMTITSVKKSFKKSQSVCMCSVVSEFHPAYFGKYRLLNYLFQQRQ